MSRWEGGSGFGAGRRSGPLDSPKQPSPAPPVSARTRQASDTLTHVRVSLRRRGPSRRSAWWLPGSSCLRVRCRLTRPGSEHTSARACARSMLLWPSARCSSGSCGGEVGGRCPGEGVGACGGRGEDGGRAIREECSGPRQMPSGPRDNPGPWKRHSLVRGRDPVPGPDVPADPGPQELKSAFPPAQKSCASQ